MSKLDFTPVDTIKFPLINKFYRQFKVRGRAKSCDLVWVMKSDDQIIAVAKLTPKAGYYLLTGVYTMISWRGRGVATKLVSDLLKDFSKPVFTFAYSKLSPWYQSLGFEYQVLPDELAPFFSAYQSQGRDICCLAANNEIV